MRNIIPNKDEFRDEIYEEIKTHPLNDLGILELRSYPKSYVKFMGSHEGAVFLTQTIYWTERMKNRGDGFFYKSVSDWSKELDITEYQVEKARKFLNEKGILEMTERQVRKNFKEQWFYRINKQRFREVFQDFLNNEYNFPQDEEIYEYEDFAEFINNERETEEIDDFREMNAEYQEVFACGQETISRNEETVASYQETVARHQENNNNVLNNKLNSELNSEPHISRSTVPSAKNSRTDLENSFDGAVGDRNTGGSIASDARRALEAFHSVGANRFEVTALNDADKKDFVYRKKLDLNFDLEKKIEWCEEHNRSFILRPSGTPLIQVDDCNRETLEAILPYAFFAEETSEGNYQAWLAFPFRTTETEIFEIRNRLFRKLESGNGGAFGATRWVGSINFKSNRNLFRVRLIHAENGRITSADELDKAGLLAEPEVPIQKQSVAKGFRGGFPDYDRCLRDKNYDRSKADASFLAICKDRGYSRDESTMRLEEVSERTQESGYFYIERTADKIFGKED